MLDRGAVTSLMVSGGEVGGGVQSCSQAASAQLVLADWVVALGYLSTLYIAMGWGSRLAAAIFPYICRQH